MSSSLYNKEGEEIVISCLEDLQMLPDRSIEVLINNQNYIEVIYLYILYKFDMHLEHYSFSLEERMKYFNVCFGIIPKLIKHQEIFLSRALFISDKAFDIIPKEAQTIHRSCLENTCSFFSGMLSTTPYLDRRLFPKQEFKIMKHNCVSVIKILVEI